MDTTTPRTAADEFATLPCGVLRRGTWIDFVFRGYYHPPTLAFAQVTAVVRDGEKTYVELYPNRYIGTHGRWFRVDGGHLLEVYRTRHDGRFHEVPDYDRPITLTNITLDV